VFVHTAPCEGDMFFLGFHVESSLNVDVILWSLFLLGWKFRFLMPDAEVCYRSFDLFFW
jgi:hypothetical protein